MFLLVAALMGLGQVAHAIEPVKGPIVADSSFGHSAHDGDEVPKDKDAAYPHHHASCHDHQVGVPADLPVGTIGCDISTPATFSLSQGFLSAEPDTLRRPPRA